MQTAAATWGNTATILRTSTDSGRTWSPARIIVPEHQTRHMPVESVIRTREGYLILPADAVTKLRAIEAEAYKIRDQIARTSFIRRPGA